MPKAVLVREKEGKRVLTYEEVRLAAHPAPGAVLLRHTAIFAGHYDYQICTGIRPARSGPPFIPGASACGVIEATGPGVRMRPGDRVVYATPRGGAFAEARLIEERLLAGIPEGIPDETAAAAFMPGMIAHMLISRVYRPEGKALFITAAAGAVGHLLTQWAVHEYGALALGEAGSPEKIRFAEAHGGVIAPPGGDLKQFAAEATGGEGVHVVYDGAGKTAFEAGLMETLRPLGLYVSFGEASGPLPALQPSLLDAKNLFFTRPQLFSYKGTRGEYIMTALEIFELISKKRIRPAVTGHFKLQEAQKAIDLIGAGKTYGCVILTP